MRSSLLLFLLCSMSGEPSRTYVGQESVCNHTSTKRPARLAGPTPGEGTGSHLGAGRRRLAAAVATGRAGRGKLAELVPDHVFLNEHADKLVPIVDFKRMSHKFRDNRASPLPSLQRLLGPCLIQNGNPSVELLVNIGAFF